MCQLLADFHCFCYVWQNCRNNFAALRILYRSSLSCMTNPWLEGIWLSKDCKTIVPTTLRRRPFPTANNEPTAFPSLCLTRRVVTMNDERAAVINDAPSIIAPRRCRHYLHPGPSPPRGTTPLVWLTRLICCWCWLDFEVDVLIEMWVFDWSYSCQVHVWGPVLARGVLSTDWVLEIW